MADILKIKNSQGQWESIVAIKGEKGDKGEDGVIGKDGTSATHSWNGTTLTITSASGTSSADLKGEKGDRGTDGDLSDAEYNSLRAKLDEVIADKDANLDGRVGGLGYVKESQLHEHESSDDYIIERTYQVLSSGQVSATYYESSVNVTVEGYLPIHIGWTFNSIGMGLHRLFYRNGSVYFGINTNTSSLTSGIASLIVTYIKKW